MLVVISGTNRPQSNTLKVSQLLVSLFVEEQVEVELLDLAQLPAELFLSGSYAKKPGAFASFQGALDRCAGLLTVVPEYNGSFPGVLKYFVDMLEFPRSLRGLPTAFVGLSAGTCGGLRAVEQIQLVYQYREALLFPQRVFLPGIFELLDAQGRHVLEWH